MRLYTCLLAVFTALAVCLFVYRIVGIEVRLHLVWFAFILVSLFFFNPSARISKTVFSVSLIMISFVIIGFISMFINDSVIYAGRFVIQAYSISASIILLMVLLRLPIEERGQLVFYFALISILIVAAANAAFYISFLYSGAWPHTLPSIFGVIVPPDDYVITAGGGSFRRATVPFVRTHDLAYASGLLLLLLHSIRYPKSRVSLIYFLSIMSFMPVIFSLSRSVILALVIYALGVRKWLVVFGALAISTFCVFFLDAFDTLEERAFDLASLKGHLDIRLQYVSSVFQGGATNFLFGYGSENWHSSVRGVDSRGSSHSTLVTMLAEQGVLSLLLFFVFGILIWRRCGRLKDKMFLIFVLSANLFYDFQASFYQYVIISMYVSTRFFTSRSGVRFP